MKLNKPLYQYYEDRLKSLQTIDPPFVRQQSQVQPKSKRPVVQWEDIIGTIVTAAYIFQFFIPTTWFSWGRFLSIFKLGF